MQLLTLPSSPVVIPRCSFPYSVVFFFFYDTSTTDIYTLSLHDALPIYADTYLPYHFNPRPDAAKFEPGSPSLLGVSALGAAIDVLLEVGPEHVERRLLELTDRLAAGLRKRGARIVSPWGAG